MLQAHLVMYLGMAVVFVSTGWAVARRSVRFALLEVAVAGAAVAILGHGLDLYAHSRGNGWALAHLIGAAGELAVLVAAAFALRDRRRAARA